MHCGTDAEWRADRGGGDKTGLHDLPSRQMARSMLLISTCHAAQIVRSLRTLLLTISRSRAG